MKILDAKKIFLIDRTTKRLKDLKQLVEECPELFHDGIDYDILSELELTIQTLKEIKGGN